MPSSFLSITNPQLRIEDEFTKDFKTSWVCASCLGGFLLSPWNTVTNKEKLCLFGWIKTSYACSFLSLGTDKTYPWVYWWANKNWKQCSLKVCGGGTQMKSVLFFFPLSKQHRKKRRDRICLLPPAFFHPCTWHTGTPTWAHILPLRRWPLCFWDAEAPEWGSDISGWGGAVGGGGVTRWKKRGSLPIRHLPKQTQTPSPVFVAPKAYVCTDILDGFSSLIVFYTELK